MGRFDPAIQKVNDLAKNEEYLGAFIFGSVARNEGNENSDLDAKVIVAHDFCLNAKPPVIPINHPIIGGVKLDLTFLTQDELREQMKRQETKGERIPMIAESIILFDKTGKIEKLKEYYLGLKPRQCTETDYQDIQFQIFHANNKAERNLDNDQFSSLLSMNIGLNDLLKFHFRLNRKWWVSNKRLLKDLDSWDKGLADLARKFLVTNEVKEKFKVWSSIIEHILKPLGGKKKIEEINCSCENCKKNLSVLLH